MSQALRSVAFRVALGPAPIPSLSWTREAILLEFVQAARLRRPSPTVRQLGRVVGRALVTVRWHVRALLRDGLIERADVGWRATAAAMDAYPWPTPKVEEEKL